MSHERKISDETLVKAWKMRQEGVYTMREVADHFCVNRETLIEDLEDWLEEHPEECT